MRKNTLLFVALFIVAAAFCANAFAADGDTCALGGFFNSVGGFLYNALPWNWGNWFGK